MSVRLRAYASASPPRSPGENHSVSVRLRAYPPPPRVESTLKLYTVHLIAYTRLEVGTILRLCTYVPTLLPNPLPRM